MAKAGVRLFVSFEYDQDLQSARNFVTQARGRGYARPILDNSLNEERRSQDSAWMKKARHLIRGSDIVVIILGPDTHNAPGVAKEIQVAVELNKKIIQIRPQGSTYSGHPNLKSQVLVWRWKNLDPVLQPIPTTRQHR
jgi:nucleoside 2-deoxyribosyltransferase